MKKLELNQMENLEGGTCGVLQGAEVGLGGAGLIFGAALATGPVGWAVWGLGAAAYSLSAYNGWGTGCWN